MNPFETGVKKLLLAQLSELFYCESQLVHALDAMARAAHDPALKRLFQEHRKETEGHVQRVIACFAELHETPRAFPCRATQGILEDGSWLIHRLKDDPSLDHALVAAAQRTEMFEAASYNSLIRMAGILGLSKVVEIAQGILDEEIDANGKLETVLHQHAEPEVAKQR
jgi:ferritin-like metal-binding protein YciE